MDADLLFFVLPIIALLVLSACFSGSETALTATSRARMLRLSQEGNRHAIMVGNLIKNRERLIGAILLGNNLVNILASALATSVMVATFNEAGVIYATILMTALVLVFAEVLPKTYALSDPDRMSMRVAPIIRVVVVAFAPVVSAVQWIVRRTLKAFGFDIDQIGDVLSPQDEIRSAIDLHHSEGGVFKRDKDMLGGVLDLHDLNVDEVIVHRKNMMMIDAGLSNREIIDKVLQSPYTRIPIWEETPENIIGILHAKDLLRALRAHQGDDDDLNIRNLLQTPWFVPETTTLREQLKAFLQKRKHFALVVDEYGALMGLVTLEDIIEEIVGEIEDEHDVAVEGVRPQPDGSAYVDGSVTIRDLNRGLDWSLPDDEANTIAGLVIHEAQTIPLPGQIFSYYGYRFEIMKRHRNQLTGLRITPPKDKREKS